MLRICAFCLAFICIMLAPLRTAHADAREFLGHWTQVYSDGGYCDCSVRIGNAEGGAFDVDASNGWSAKLTPVDQNGRTVLIGTGRWDEAKAGRFYRQYVAIEFRLEGQRLHLRFFSQDNKGRRVRIKGIFTREVPTAKRSDGDDSVEWRRSLFSQHMP